MSSSSSSLEEQRKTATTDLASLSRVSHRLALIDTSDKLQTVLDKLLSRLLQRIGDNNQLLLGTTDEKLKDILSKIHYKLIEMLSHIMKRVRDDTKCKLNAYSILQLLVTVEEEQENNNEDQEEVEEKEHNNNNHYQKYQ